jgi:hypothetical protein
MAKEYALSLLKKFAAQGGSYRPQTTRSFFPSGKNTNLPVRLTSLELDENGSRKIGGGNEVPCVNVVFTFQLIDDPDSPDPDMPRSFSTKNVDNYQLMSQADADALGSAKPHWLDQSIQICAETVTKATNITLGEDDATERDTNNLVASLQYIQQYLQDSSNPKPELTLYTEEKQDGQYTRRKIYFNGVTNNPVA